MKKRSVIIVAAMVWALAGAASPLAAGEKAPPVDIGALLKEIMDIRLEGDQSQMAIWYPYEFFVQAGLAEGGASRAEVEKEIAFLKPYNAVVVQCSTDRPDGTSAYQNEAAVRARVRLRLKDGTEVAPLKTVPPMVTATMAMIKVMIASEGDAGSRNTYILIFSASDAKGRPVVEVDKKDKLVLVLKADGKYKETVFTWRTPFDAVTPAPPCAKCKEKVSAKWSFCAWCGGRLGE